MSKEIKDYLHLYLGCEVMDFYNDKIGTLNGIITMSEGIKACVFHNTTWHLNFDEIKPILRPLSDMTEEEMRELLLLHFGNTDDIREMFNDKFHRIERSKEVKQNVKYGTSIPFSTFDKEGKHYMTGTLSQNCLTPNQFLYALKQGFDLFGLIESGLAIDKTKQNKPTPNDKA